MTDFEAHRSFLVGLAYRMLGSVSDAEDIVQDAFLRWRDTDQAAIEHPRAYLARIVSRLCLDKMKSATARREQYVGTWLPEPLVGSTLPAAHELAEDLSLALMMTLERLSPLERAAFLLHDVFDQDYAEIATTLERSEAACRQLAARAREHVREAKPRFTPDSGAQAKLADAFQTALTTGDVGALMHLLADDAVLYTDGGGKKLAALNPIFGRDKILRFFAGVAAKRSIPRPDQVERATINGMPGYILRTEEGPETFALEIVGEQVVAIYGVRNPDKLKHLA